MVFSIELVVSQYVFSINVFLMFKTTNSTVQNFVYLFYASAVYYFTLLGYGY